jgi:glutathione S-transferase
MAAAGSLQRARAGAVPELARRDAYAAGQRYLAGDQFTLADIAVLPLLMHFERGPEAVLAG